MFQTSMTVALISLILGMARSVLKEPSGNDARPTKNGPEAFAFGPIQYGDSLDYNFE